MTHLSDRPARYGLVTRVLHWGMAVLFAAQFVSAAAHWALPRENALREALWTYHYDLGTTLFVLVALRGAWGLANIPRRPSHAGLLGRAAVVGHVAIYALMVIVPFLKILATAGSELGVKYLGFTLIPGREPEVEWMTAPQEWHGEMGWILALLILGHVGMALVWHRLIRRDEVLARMAG